MDSNRQTPGDAVDSKFYLRRMFQFKDPSITLAPTHEEEVTTLVSALIDSQKQLPLRLYQIGPKFRNELRPRNGLMRLREFIMKDLYTFDSDQEAAMSTYHEVCGAYKKIFSSLKLPILVAQAYSGSMGGNFSQEFHVESSVGDDTLHACIKCSSVQNSENSFGKCSSCSGEFKILKGIEVGHTFNLGTKYSNVFKSKCGKPIEMGCFGIGVSRLLAVLAEIHRDDLGLLFPTIVAPYRLVVVPTSNSNYPNAFNLADTLANSYPSLKGEILVDDRELSFGRKLHDAYLLGMPQIAIVGKDYGIGKIELENRKTKLKSFYSIDELGRALIDS